MASMTLLHCAVLIFTFTHLHSDQAAISETRDSPAADVGMLGSSQAIATAPGCAKPTQLLHRAWPVAGLRDSFNAKNLK